MSTAKGRTLYLNGKSMDYATFGKGQEPLIVIPGLGDGLDTVKSMAKSLSLVYKRLGKKYHVYVFSRINELPDEYSTKDMAADIAEAMNVLNIESAFVLGVSQGGMIAQYLTLDFPEKVKKLVLAVTTGHCTNLLEKRIKRWLLLAQEGTYSELMLDMAHVSYTRKSYSYLRYLYWFLGQFGKVKNQHRLVVQAQSCLHHQADLLEKIVCPTLIVGAVDDQVIGLEASYELEKRIPNNRLEILADCGHALYEKNKEFHQLRIEFLAE